MADRAPTRHGMEPLQVDIRHSPRTGKPVVTAKVGKGIRLKIRTSPTM